MPAELARTASCRRRRRARLIEGGMPTEATVAPDPGLQISPITCRATNRPRFMRAKVPSSIVRRWRTGWGRQPSTCVRCMNAFGKLRQRPKLFADEATMLVLDPGRGRAETGQLWAYAADDRPWGGADPPGRRLCLMRRFAKPTDRRPSCRLQGDPAGRWLCQLCDPYGGEVGGDGEKLPSVVEFIESGRG